MVGNGDGEQGDFGFELANIAGKLVIGGTNQGRAAGVFAALLGGAPGRTAAAQ